VTAGRAVLLSLAVTAPANASAQRAATSDDFLGLTRCEAGRAVTRLREDVRDSSLQTQLHAHEAVHRAQAEEFPTCEVFLASLTSARRIIDVELPAYCAQWRVAVGQGADPVETRREFGWRIAAQSGAMENRLDIVQRFERECTPLTPQDPRADQGSRGRASASRQSTTTAAVPTTTSPDDGIASHLSDSLAAPVPPRPGARKPAHSQ
jgi:hypothetical protein